jgi:hypothetical protein
MLEGVSPRLRSPVLVVGRGEHLAAAEAALERARAGGPAAVLIGGEAGIGKSRLVGEFTTAAANAGCAGARLRLPGPGRRGLGLGAAAVGFLIGRLFHTAGA